jgi:hypothetical protein
VVQWWQWQHDGGNSMAAAVAIAWRQQRSGGSTAVAVAAWQWWQQWR